jgi:hypothetical protein
MKQCANCKTDNPDTESYCTVCGKPLPATFRVTEPAVFTGGNAPPVRERFESHLVKAIIATTCCCIPFGIVAIYHAAQVAPYLRNNDHNGAREASAKASLWSNFAIGMGILMQAVLFALGRTLSDSVQF